MDQRSIEKLDLLTSPRCPMTARFVSGEVLLMKGDIGGIFRHLRLTVMPRDAAPD